MSILIVALVLLQLASIVTFTVDYPHDVRVLWVRERQEHDATVHLAAQSVLIICLLAVILFSKCH